jgi:predicted nucleic acid-binding protein
LKCFVLDSWALLEWLFDQPGAARVEEILSMTAGGDCELRMSWINAGEAVYMTARKRGIRDADELEKRLPTLPVRFALPDADAILRAARIKAKARLSHADAFAVDLALTLGAGLVTGDPEIAGLGFLDVVRVRP